MLSRFAVHLHVVALLFCATVWQVCADQVTLQNGDRYNGKIIFVTTNNVTLLSDVLGNVTLPRTKVAAIQFSEPATNTVPAISVVSPTPGQKSAGTGKVQPDLRQLSTQSNLIQQVQAQFLSGAGPEANAQFSQMMNDLMTGKMSVGDLSTQAKAAADQLRALKKELGADAGSELDGYLSVLDSFLKEAPPPTTNATATTASKSQPASDQK